MNAKTQSDAATADSTPEPMTEQALIDSLQEQGVESLFGEGSATPEAGPRAPAGEDSTDAAEQGEGREGTEKADETNDDQGTDREAKSEERRQKTWEELNRAKDTLATERAKLAQERREFLERVSNIEGVAKGTLKTAEEYDRFAKDWEQEGNDSLAANARAQAERLRTEAKTALGQAQSAQLARERDAVLAEAVKANPDLADQKSELWRGVFEMVTKRPDLVPADKPRAILDVVEYVKANTASKRLAAVEKELAETKQRLAEREKLLQPATGARTGGAKVGDRDFAKLTRQEREAALERVFRDAESNGVSLFRG